MAEIDDSLKKLEDLLTRAVMVPAFHQGLIDDPEKTAKQVGIVLNPQDRKMLDIIIPHMIRFGSDPKRDRSDANSWAVGILADKVVETWKPSVTSIQRRHTALWP